MKRDIGIRDIGSHGSERTSRRVVNGVEIVERETVTKLRLADDNVTGQPPTRLVVAPSRGKLFVSKTRSQLGDIDAYLKSITRRPLRAK